MFHSWSIARRLFVANLLFVLVLTAVFGAFSVVEARDRAYDDAGGRMLAIADVPGRQSPGAGSGFSCGSHQPVLQPYALEVMDDADADFITIMAPDRTRWTHPRHRGAWQALHRDHRARPAG